MLRLFILLTIGCVLLPSSAFARRQEVHHVRHHLSTHAHHGGSHRYHVRSTKRHMARPLVSKPRIEFPCMTGTVLLDAYTGAFSAYDRSAHGQCRTLVGTLNVHLQTTTCTGCVFMLSDLLLYGGGHRSNESSHRHHQSRWTSVGIPTRS